MSKKIILFSVSLFILSFSFAQLSTVKGNLKDTVANVDVSNAVVALLTPKDSVLRSFTRSKPDGSYNFSNIQQGNYILMVMHPSFADYVDNIEIKQPEEIIPAIPVTSKSKLLAAIIIKSGSPIKIKGDTTIYTADSFNVSANANVEELLKKLPGIQVDKNGEIKAMGEKVEKVLVDGEEFFGDDPGMAVKNLRADAVKEVQVFDKKSEQAEFTGIDDGNTKKTINLKLKEDKKTGYFGKIDLSGGLQKDIDDRYNNNILFSTFKGKRKLSAFFLNGNTGQDGLNWQDMEKYGGGNDNVSMSMDDDGEAMYMWNGGSVDDEPNVNTENGFIKNINTGVQYSNKWKDKYTLNLSPKYNEQDYTNSTKTLSQQRIEDSVLNTDANDLTNIRRKNFKTKLTYEAKLDSANTLKFTGNVNFYKTESETSGNSVTTNKANELVNERNARTSNSNNKYGLSGNLLFKHKFKKARRTFSLSTDWNYINTESSNYLETYNRSYDPLDPFIQEVNQLITPDKSTQKLSTKIIYTEPLSKQYSLEIGYQLSYNYGKNDQVTRAFDAGTGKYELTVDSLTNKFRQSILINTPSFKISYSKKKLKYNIGSGFGLTNFNLTDQTVQRDYIRNYTNFFPSASLTYSYKANHSFRMNYNGNTSQPSINQLQPLRNNNDKFNQYVGNPDLKPSFANSINIQHSGYNFIKDRWHYQSVYVSVTSNSFTNDIIINPATGEKITRPINTNGNISMGFYGGMQIKLKKLDTRIWISPNFNYNRFSNFINSRKSVTDNTNSGLSINASKSKDKKYDINIGNSFSFNNNRTSEINSSDNFYTNTASAEGTVYYKKVWSLSSDVQYFTREKTAQSATNLNNTLWNAKIQRTFKSNEFTVYFRVRDILNQNIGIDRTFNGNSFTETRNDRLKRYFMVGFAWDFKNKASQAKK